MQNKYAVTIVVLFIAVVAIIKTVKPLLDDSHDDISIGLQTEAKPNTICIGNEAVAADCQVDPTVMGSQAIYWPNYRGYTYPSNNWAIRYANGSY